MTPPRRCQRASFLQSGDVLRHLVSSACPSVFPSAAPRLCLGVRFSCCFPCTSFPGSGPRLDSCPFSVMMLSEGRVFNAPLTDCATPLNKQSRTKKLRRNDLPLHLVNAGGSSAGRQQQLSCHLAPPTSAFSSQATFSIWSASIKTLSARSSKRPHCLFPRN